MRFPRRSRDRTGRPRHSRSCKSPRTKILEPSSKNQEPIWDLVLGSWFLVLGLLAPGHQPRLEDVRQARVARQDADVEAVLTAGAARDAAAEHPGARSVRRGLRPDA